MYHHQCTSLILTLICGWSLLVQAQTESIEPPNPRVQPQPAPFEGQDWRLIAYRQGSQTLTPLAEGRPPHFRFADGQLSGSAGCNQIQGRYQAEADVWRLSGLAATRMACPEPLMQQESAVSRHLQAAAHYRLADGRLELMDESGQWLLSLTPLTADPEPQGLTGRTWRVEGYADSQRDLVKPRARIDLTFDPQGRISGFDGCNHYLSGFVRSGQSLSLGPIGVTSMACPAGPDRERQAQGYRQTLGRVQTYRVLGDRLSLLDAAGQVLIELRAVAPAGP